EKLIEKTVVEIVGWQTGRFVFEMGNLKAKDDFRHMPESIMGAGYVNMQSTLMDAVRILDERRREGTHKSEQAALEVEQAGNINEEASTPLAEPEPLSESKESAAVDQEPVSESAASDLKAQDDAEPPVAEPPVSEPPVADIQAQPELKNEEDSSEIVIRPSSPGTDSVGVRSSPELLSPQTDEEVLAELAGDPGFVNDDELLELLGERLEKSGHIDRKALLLSRDGLIKNSLRSVCSDNHINLYVSELEQDILQRAALWRRQGTLPVVVCDMSASADDARWMRNAFRTLERLRKAFPEVSVTVLGDASMEQFSEILAAGARVVLPRPDQSLGREKYVVEMKKLFDTILIVMKAEFSRRTTLTRRVLEGRRQMANLRSRIQEISDPNSESDISLVVLRYVADFMERCVLFLVRPNDLFAVGSFGIGPTSVSAEQTDWGIAKVKIPLSDSRLLQAVVDNGSFYNGPIKDPLFHEHLYEHIGEPENPMAVLLPLKTGDRTAALIYGDYGSRNADLAFSESLEILAIHAGLAFDLALAKRDITKVEVAPEIEES
ncbi:hypothetical protein KAI87_01490, partial [Myxococcota bacterium]|nr:hypothetical protein [Myxococcota bacterium]